MSLSSDRESLQSSRCYECFSLPSPSGRWSPRRHFAGLGGLRRAVSTKQRPALRPARAGARTRIVDAPAKSARKARFGQGSIQGRGELHDSLLERVVEQHRLLQRQQRIPGVRNIITRLGIVIGPTDMLKTMLIASRCFMGCVLGSGRQRISWIAQRDMARAFDYLIKNRTCSARKRGLLPRTSYISFIF